MNYQDLITVHAMERKLIELGFLYNGTCNCNGPLTHKYKNREKGFKLYWTKSQKKFRIKNIHTNKYLTGYHKEHEFEKVFQELIGAGV